MPSDCSDDLGTSAEKVCSTCSVKKPLDEFHRQAASPDGRQRRCRECTKAAGRAYKAANSDKVAENNRRWRTENPDAAKASTDAWRARNRERHAESQRKWDAENRDQLLANRRARRAADPQKYREALAEWKATNPERVRDYQRKRRAAGYGGDIGQVDGEQLWAECGGLCALCGSLIGRDLPWPDPESASLDHIHPLSKGGAHDQDNVQWTHLACNLSKGSRLDITHPIPAAPQRGLSRTGDPSS